MTFNDFFLKEIATILEKYERLQAQTERFKIFSVLHNICVPVRENIES